MSFQVTTAFVNQFSSNVFHLSQQQGSRLRPYVKMSMQKGVSAFYDRIGSVSAVEKAGRHTDTPVLDVPQSRRMVTLTDFEWATLVDDQDKIRMLNDPTSEFAQAAKWALGRSMDKKIITALSGNAAGGVGGADGIILPNSQKIVPTTGAVVSAFSSDTLLAIKKIMDDNDIDPSLKRFIAISSQQLQDLLKDPKIQSADYNTVKALVNGELNTFMGFEFVRTQLLPKVNLASFTQTTGVVGVGANTLTNARLCSAWAEGAVMLAVGEDIVGKIDVRPDKSYATQVYARMSIGATRMEDEKVVSIYCKESDTVVT